VRAMLITDGMGLGGAEKVRENDQRKQLEQHSYIDICGEFCYKKGGGPNRG